MKRMRKENKEDEGARHRGRETNSLGPILVETYSNILNNSNSVYIQLPVKYKYMRGKLDIQYCPCIIVPLGSFIFDCYNGLLSY